MASLESNPPVKASAKTRKEGLAARRRFRNLQRRMGKRGADRMIRLQRGARYEPFSDQEIFVRDHWVCKLCGYSIDRKAKHPHLKSATVDHIVPLAHGGHHARRNVQCAHL